MFAETFFDIFHINDKWRKRVEVGGKRFLLKFFLVNILYCNVCTLEPDLLSS